MSKIKKTKKFNLEEFIKKNKADKKKYIISESKKIKVTKDFFMSVVLFFSIISKYNKIL